jgi:hypothetical protein
MLRKGRRLQKRLLVGIHPFINATCLLSIVFEGHRLASQVKTIPILYFSTPLPTAPLRSTASSTRRDITQRKPGIAQHNIRIPVIIHITHVHSQPAAGCRFCK